MPEPKPAVPCPRCGKKSYRGALYCAKCGEKVREVTVVARAPKAKPAAAAAGATPPAPAGKGNNEGSGKRQYDQIL